MHDDTSTDYTAANIRILTLAEVDVLTPWNQAAALSRKYPSWPFEFILRGVVACEYSGIPLDHLERRYLDEDRSVPASPQFQDAYRQVLAEHQGCRGATTGFLRTHRGISRGEHS